MRDTGCLDHWEKMYSSKINKCTAPVVKNGADSISQRRHKLSLQDFSGPFLLLFAGVIIAFLTFLVTKCYFQEISCVSSLQVLSCSENVMEKRIALRKNRVHVKELCKSSRPNR